MTKKIFKSALALCAFLFATSQLNAQIQLESAMKNAEKAPFENIIPKAPNNMVFEGVTTHDKITYECKHKFDRTIYVDAEKGKDSNNGLSDRKPIKTLTKLAEMGITFGDRVLLKGGQTHFGTIELINLNKAKKSKKYIQISSYGDKKATIDFKGYPGGVWIENTSNVIVSDLKLTGNGGPDNDTFMVRDDEKNKAQRFAVRILSNKETEHSLVENIVTYNLDIFDVYLLNPVKVSRACRQWDMNDGAGWGWGIFGEVINKGQGIRNVEVNHITVRDISQMGIRFKGNGAIDGTLARNVDNVRIDNCVVYQAGGPGMQFNRCNNSHIKHCRITESGNRNDNRKWGRGSGMWTWGVNNFLLERNIFEGAQGIADCCGAHIDFNCSNVVIQYCLSRYNCGGFIEILGLNHNCSYRYNVSVNDGWRNLKDEKQAFWGKVGTPGCVISVNGHNNEKQYKGAYNSYIYNNTIINTREGSAPYTNPNIFNISTSNEGVLFMNNIFWFEDKMGCGWSLHRWKDGAAYEAAFDFKISYEPIPNKTADKSLGNSVPAKTRPMNEKELKKMGLVMKNNIYRRYNYDGNDKFTKVSKALAEGYWDEFALGGNPQFSKVMGSEAADFVPKNSKLINRGMEIPKLKSDKTKYGIYFGGLKMTEDFFGNPIDVDIIGAIVPNAPITDWSKIGK